MFRPGFLGKVARTSVLEHYGLRTLLYGTLLPGPDIAPARRRADARVRDAGFEVGVHCYDHVAWQDYVARRDARLDRAADAARARALPSRCSALAPRVHGAAGWQMNEPALALEEQLGFAYASDTRGSAPFMPLLGGRRGRVPQLPTTLPTLDELIGLDGASAANVHARLLERTQAVAAPQVFTLHAELEGMKLLPVLERLLQGWRAQGHELVSLAALCATLDVAALPAAAIVAGTVPGRSGTLACQQA